MKIENNIIFLDCTRLDNSKTLISRNNSNDFSDVYSNIQRISNILITQGIKEIVLADDVIFSGSVSNTIISEFKKYGITIIGIASSIATEKSYNLFKELPLGVKCGYLLSDNVIDQICERDFYFGIAGSGISVLKNKVIYKSPYFIPFGNPVVRASMPKPASKYFSLGCLARSIILWEELERLNNKKYYIRDLPERVLKTKEDEEVVKLLKKEYQR